MPASRLKPGVDVPWVTTWSQERVAGVAPCPEARGRLAIQQEDKPGFGRPIYSENHLVRQRASVARMLCPMCGAATAEGDRWSLTATAETAGSLRARGLSHLLPPEAADAQFVLNAGAIAPLHLACAERSSKECPHLLGMTKKALLPFPSRWWVTPLSVEARSTDPRDVLAAKPPPPIRVVSFLQIVGLM